MDNLNKIAQLINNGMNLLGRKIDSLALELRNKRQPDSKMNISIPENVAEAIGSAMKEGLKNLKVPTPNIHIPDQKAPVVNIPAPIVKIDAPIIPAPIVNVPPANITVSPAEVNFPESMKVEGMDKLLESVNRETPAPAFDFSSKNPLAVMVVDRKGKHIEDFASELTAPSMVSIKVGNTAVGSDNPLPVTVDGFSIPKFDTQEIDESLAPATTTITYKLASVTVATKLITVSGTLTTITVTLA